MSGLKVGEVCVLQEDATLWREYPSERSVANGRSYRSFAAGETFTVVGQHDRDGVLYYVLDALGNTYIASTRYLMSRVRVIG